MSKEKQNFFSFDPVPMSLPDMPEIMGQLQEAFKTALSIPSEDFPVDKKVEISWNCKVILVPELNIHITRNND